MVGEEDKGFKDRDAEMAVSTSIALSQDNKPVSNSLDLTSVDIALIDLNQSKDWRSKGLRSAKTKPRHYPQKQKPQPSDSHYQTQKAPLNKQKKKNRGVVTPNLRILIH